MEDTLSISTSAVDKLGVLVCSVFDGHGGAKTSKKLKKAFNSLLIKNITKAAKQTVTKEIVEATFLEFDAILAKVAPITVFQCLSCFRFLFSACQPLSFS